MRLRNKILFSLFVPRPKRIWLSSCFCLSIFLSVYLSVWLIFVICPSSQEDLTICQSVCLSVYRTFLSVHSLPQGTKWRGVKFCTSFWLSLIFTLENILLVCLSVCLSYFSYSSLVPRRFVCLSVCLSICLSLSVCLSVSFFIIHPSFQDKKILSDKTHWDWGMTLLWVTKMS